MEKLITLIEGKKTYIVAAVAGFIAVWQAVNPGVEVPEWIYLLLSALGLGAVRSAIK